MNSKTGQLTSPLRVFSMSNYELLTLHSKIQMQYRNHLSISHSTSMSSPTNYILTLVKPFSVAWYFIPLLKTGALASSHDLFYELTMKKLEKKTACSWPIATIGRNTCPMAASSGFYKRSEPPQLSNTRGIVPAHHRSHQNDQQSWSIFCRCLVCCCPGGRWGDTERVVARWWHP